MRKPWKGSIGSILRDNTSDIPLLYKSFYKISPTILLFSITHRSDRVFDKGGWNGRLNIPHLRSDSLLGLRATIKSIQTPPLRCHAMTIAENLFIPFPSPLSLIQKNLKTPSFERCEMGKFFGYFFFGGGWRKERGRGREEGGKRMGRGMFSDVGTVDLKLRRESEGGGGSLFGLGFPKGSMWERTIF